MTGNKATGQPGSTQEDLKDIESAQNVEGKRD